MKFVAFIFLFAHLVAASNLRPDGSHDNENDDDDHDHEHHHPFPKEFCEEVEKGIRCKTKGSMKEGKGMKECEAGMRMNVTAVFDADAIVNHLADSMHGQMMEILPMKSEFVPPDDILKEMKIFDSEETVLALEEDFSKTVEFGGKAHVEFGCKVTFAKKNGKFTKSVDCAMHGRGGMEKEDEDLLLSQEQ